MGFCNQEFALPAEDSMALNIGDTAPEFELQAVVRDRKQKFRLSDYRGSKHVVLAFYAVDFSPA